MKIRLKLDREFHLIDPGFKSKRKRYLLQSFFASIALFFILLFEEVGELFLIAVAHLF